MKAQVCRGKDAQGVQERLTGQSTCCWDAGAQSFHIVAPQPVTTSSSFLPSTATVPKRSRPATQTLFVIKKMYRVGTPNPDLEHRPNVVCRTFHSMGI